MAGGKGTRMKNTNEKLLLKYIHPTILHVIFALKDSNCFSKVIAVTSKNSPKTQQMLKNAGIETFETAGRGYSEDLNLVLRSIDEHVFVASGDMPLLDKEIISQIVKNYKKGEAWTSYIVTSDFLYKLGFNSNFSITYQNKKCHYTGLSIIDAKTIKDSKKIEENYVILDDHRIAFNMNTEEDFKLLGAAGNFPT